MSGHRNCVKCDHTSCSVQKHLVGKESYVGEEEIIEQKNLWATALPGCCGPWVFILSDGLGIQQTPVFWGYIWGLSIAHWLSAAPAFLWDYNRQRKAPWHWCQAEAVPMLPCSKAPPREPQNNGFWRCLPVSDCSWCHLAKQNYKQNGCFGSKCSKEYMTVFPSINLPSSAQTETYHLWWLTFSPLNYTMSVSRRTVSILKLANHQHNIK